MEHFHFHISCLAGDIFTAYQQLKRHSLITTALADLSSLLHSENARSERFPALRHFLSKMKRGVVRKGKSRLKAHSKGGKA